MPTIPQRELRNNVADVLRRAEGGERFTITVNGRAVAALGPLEPDVEVRATRPLGSVLADTPVDAAWSSELEDLRRADDEHASDPWRD